MRRRLQAKESDLDYLGHDIFDNPLLLSRKGINFLVPQLERIFDNPQGFFFPLSLNLPESTIPMRIQDGVAIIDIFGILFARIDPLSAFLLDGIETSQIDERVQEAIKNTEVRAIILNFDSPGGEVATIENTAKNIRAAREQTEKPIIAVANQSMTSGAYWIGSAAGQIILDDNSAVVGSIGVVVIHREFSEANKKRGIAITEVTAGSLKASTSPFKPLSLEGRQELQSRVDQIHQVFIDAVAKNRGMDRAEILPFAEGQILTGVKAVEAGLADAVKPLSEVISILNLEVKPMPETVQATKPAPHPVAENPALTVEILQRDHAEIYAAIFEAGKDAGRKEGASAERDRIAAIDAIAEPGFEAIVEEAKGDPDATAGAVAIKICQERRKRGGASLSAIKSESPKAVEPVANQDLDPEEEQMVAVMSGKAKP